MNTTSKYTEFELEKIGNTLIYLSKNVKKFTKTKALKLLYLLDVTSIEKYGVPFLGLDYKVWKLGPVAKDLKDEFDCKTEILSEYIIMKQHQTINRSFVKIMAKQDFCDDEFSDNDMELLEFISSEYKNSSADYLIELTHSKDSLWHKTASENNLLNNNGDLIRSRTNNSIDISSLLNEHQLLMYNDYLENREIERSFGN